MDPENNYPPCDQRLLVSTYPRMAASSVCCSLIPPWFIPSILSLASLFHVLPILNFSISNLICSISRGLVTTVLAVSQYTPLEDVEDEDGPVSEAADPEQHGHWDIEAEQVTNDGIEVPLERHTTWHDLPTFESMVVIKQRRYIDEIVGGNADNQNADKD